MITTKYVFNSLEEIQQKVNPILIYQYYSDKPVSTETIISSPLREDKNPSFKIWENGNFYDFATQEKGSVIDFVCKKFSINFLDAMIKISNDFKHLNVPYREVSLSKINDKIKIVPYYRDWDINDRNYWSSYNITKSVLTSLNVLPIKYYSINNNLFRANKLAYCYQIGSRFKIYQPYSKLYKFIGNTNENSIVGYNLINKNEDLYIASSLKDAAVLIQLGLNAIAPNSESTRFKKSIMDNLFNLYKNIYVVFDWDEAGYNLSDAFLDYYSEYNLKQLKIKAPFKDVAEFSQNFGLETTNKLILNEKYKVEKR